MGQGLPNQRGNLLNFLHLHNMQRLGILYNDMGGVVRGESRIGGKRERGREMNDNEAYPPLQPIAL
jgi:hypothetical protein